MRPLTFLLSTCGILINLLGCSQDSQNIQSNCQSVTESVYVNDRFPSDIEEYHPDSLRVFTFEYDFKDSVAVFVENNVVAKGYLATKSNGSAGRLLIKAQANEEIRINTPNGCAHFQLKEGYKYLYINRLTNKEWDVAYSNFGRGYF